MANPEHLAKLKEGNEAWNRWRRDNPDVAPDLSGANLIATNLGGTYDVRVNSFESISRGASIIEEVISGEADLSGANLSFADLSYATLKGANLNQADLTEAKLSSADLYKANLIGTDLTRANLGGERGVVLRFANLNKANLRAAILREADLVFATLKRANLNEADLSQANLSNANLGGADLRKAYLNEANLTNAGLGGADLTEASLCNAILQYTDLRRANLSRCRVYGSSAWDVFLEGAIQSNLIITSGAYRLDLDGQQEPDIQVDNLEVAQFVYLLLNNKNIRDLIDTVGKKAVLILGRFTPERKAVLEAIRDALRQYGYVPILFDFEKPSTRDLEETIMTLAGLSRFILADISDPKSIPQELAVIVPQFPSVPVQPLLQSGYEPWSMYDHINRYGWVLPLHRYSNQQELLDGLRKQLILPADS
jgi:uncharacterized protein YjbI with pentapeptide repeats